MQVVAALLPRLARGDEVPEVQLEAADGSDTDVGWEPLPPVACASIDAVSSSRR